MRLNLNCAPGPQGISNRFRPCAGGPLCFFLVCFIFCSSTSVMERNSLLTSCLVLGSTSDPLDWGLKSHRSRVSEPALIHIYWWMILYQLVIFRTHGLSNYLKTVRRQTRRYHSSPQASCNRPRKLDAFLS